MSTVFFVMEIIGTVAFSISGSLAAIKKGLDLLGITVVGLTTAIGGGILRDIILGVTPPYAFSDIKYSAISVAVSLLLFIILYLLKKDISNKFIDVLFLVIDSIGLAVFTVVGVQVPQNVCGHAPFLNIFIGVVTAVGGGVIRDIILNQLPYIFTKHFYACASILGSAAYVILNVYLSDFISSVISIAFIITLRFLAAIFRWRLPKCNINNE